MGQTTHRRRVSPDCDLTPPTPRGLPPTTASFVPTVGRPMGPGRPGQPFRSPVSRRPGWKEHHVVGRKRRPVGVWPRNPPGIRLALHRHRSPVPPRTPASRQAHEPAPPPPTGHRRRGRQHHPRRRDRGPGTSRRRIHPHAAVGAAGPPHQWQRLGRAQVRGRRDLRDAEPLRPGVQASPADVRRGARLRANRFGELWHEGPRGSHGGDQDPGRRLWQRDAGPRSVAHGLRPRG
jgi:hypothetical protein